MSATLNVRLLLQAPLPTAFPARTFPVSSTFLGGVALLFHDRLAMPVFLTRR